MREPTPPSVQALADTDDKPVQVVDNAPLGVIINPALPGRHDFCLQNKYLLLFHQHVCSSTNYLITMYVYLLSTKLTTFVYI